MKELYRKIFKEDIPLREIMYRLILMICIVALCGTTVMTIITKQPWQLDAVQILGAVVMLVCLWLSVRFRIMDQAAVVILLLLHTILLPEMFFYGGGVESAASLWIVLAHVVTCILLRGKARIIVEGWAVVTTLSIYIYTYRHPDRVIPLPDRMAVYTDYEVGFVCVTILIASLLIIQERSANRERMKIEEQKEEIERMGKSKDVFFASMSHEIRTPINTIIGLNEMNLREDISPEIAENSLNIQSASKILLALINDILDLSKIETGKMEIVPVQYETGVMFSDIVNIIWVRASEKKLDFRIDISEDMPSMLFGDEVRIKQILMNLLNNAVKYTPKGEIVLTANSERLDTNRVLLRISVSDTGIGIKKENLDGLFDSFRRVDQEKNRNIEGTGLGLSIAKQLIELMNGKIMVDSIYTQGSTFTVVVEQQIVDEKPIGIRDFTIRNKAENRKKYKKSFEAPEAKVLIVDDNSMNLNVAKKLLRATKVQVDTASSGKECLRLTQQNYYHAIFMDHMMPVMDGLETLKQIRKQPNGMCKEVPVIALTANAGGGVEKVYKDYGFMGYLAKPINGALFEATLLKYLPKDVIEYSAELDEKEKTQNGIVHVFQKSEKKAIAITTDCTCDLPIEWLNSLGVKYQCNIVYMGDHRYRDFTEITADNLIDYMRREDAGRVYSVPAAVEDYETFFASVLAEANEVIHVALAAGSGIAYKTAREAAQSFDNVHVIDSAHLSCGMGLMTLHATQMVKEGKTVEEICSELDVLKNKVCTSFMVPNANAMYKSGKVGGVLNWISDNLDIRLVLQLVKGKITCKGIHMGRLERCRARYVKQQLKHAKKIDNSILFVAYAGCTLKERKMIREEIAKYIKFDRIVEAKASASISCFCGAGTFGLMFGKK